jgi:hypothetical protein
MNTLYLMLHTVLFIFLLRVTADYLGTISRDLRAINDDTIRSQYE